MIGHSAEREQKIDKKLNSLVAKQGHKEHTCDEIASYCGMSKQAVHQIQGRALRKLFRNHSDELKTELVTPIGEGQDVTWYNS